MGKWCRCPSSLIDADRAVVGLRADRHCLIADWAAAFWVYVARACRGYRHDVVQFGAGQLRFNRFPVCESGVRPILGLFAIVAVQAQA
jgi:hypothetical protein